MGSALGVDALFELVYFHFLNPALFTEVNDINFCAFYCVRDDVKSLLMLF